MTRHGMRGRDFAKCRIVAVAAFRGVGATWVEMATFRWIGRGRGFSTQANDLRPGFKARTRYGRKQCLRIGVPGRVQDFIDQTPLDDAPQIHHRDFMGDEFDNRHVVGDE